MDAASAHLARLGAISRPTGSNAAADARAYCTSVLRQLGFTVTERPFEYSKFPGAWATPVAGLLVPAFATAIAFVHSAPRSFAVGLIGAVLLASAGFAYVGRAGVLDLRFMRARGVNLEATRGDAPPTVWLIAHIDSKWQPVSMILRVLGVLTSGIGLVGLAILAAVRDAPPDPTVFGVLGFTCLGAIPLILSYVGGRNHGTLDNASGVAAVLEAAEFLPSGSRVGVLITDAEELALAGAHAWARSRAAVATPGIALNCDSIDDDGPLTVMYGSPVPHGVLSAVNGAARSTGQPLRAIRLIPGVLTDHVALAGAGWTTLTLSRGTLRTLQRIHTSRDTLETMRGTGIQGAARVLVDTATELS